MTLSAAQAAAIRRRRARDREASEELAAERRRDRVGAVFGLEAIDAAWSNTGYAWYHLGPCTDGAPRPLVVLANLEASTTRCAACHRPLTDPPR